MGKLTVLPQAPWLVKVEGRGREGRGRRGWEEKGGCLLLNLSLTMPLCSI